MPMTREERKGLHKKQERMQVGRGVPIASDLKDGVRVLRKTSEGIVEYIKNKGVLYKKVLDRA